MAQGVTVTTDIWVNMTDVDLVQVNFARFFQWMDQASGNLLRVLGHPLSSILASGHATPVVQTSCEYYRPVGLDAEVQIRSAITTLGNASYEVTHLFQQDGVVFAKGSMKHVWIELEPVQRSRPVPDWLRQALVENF